MYIYIYIWQFAQILVPKPYARRPCAHLVRFVPRARRVSLVREKSLHKVEQTLCAALCVPCAYLVRTLCVPSLCAPLPSHKPRQPCALVGGREVRLHKARFEANCHIYIYIVFHEESESEVEKCQNFRARRVNIRKTIWNSRV